jgi:hypothetical protein
MGGETCCPAREGGGGVIVLDEHLLGLSIDRAIARWYAGKVGYITELRPQHGHQGRSHPFAFAGSDATHLRHLRCGGLLAQECNATRRYCIVCFPISMKSVGASSRPCFAVCFGRRDFGRSGSGWARWHSSPPRPSASTPSINLPSANFRWQGETATMASWGKPLCPPKLQN